MKEKKGLLLRGTRQLNWGAAASGLGFLLYIAAAALEWQGAANAVGVIAGAVSLYVVASVAAERQRDREHVSLNLLWGQAALAVLNGMCAVLAIRGWLGI